MTGPTADLYGLFPKMPGRVYISAGAREFFSSGRGTTAPAERLALASSSCAPDCVDPTNLALSRLLGPASDSAVVFTHKIAWVVHSSTAAKRGRNDVF